MVLTSLLRLRGAVITANPSSFTLYELPQLTVSRLLTNKVIAKIMCVFFKENFITLMLIIRPEKITLSIPTNHNREES